MPDKKNFATRLERWFEENKRSLPWRETTDPYRIWISESRKGWIITGVL